VYKKILTEVQVFLWLWTTGSSMSQSDSVSWIWEATYSHKNLKPWVNYWVTSVRTSPLHHEHRSKWLSLIFGSQATSQWTVSRVRWGLDRLRECPFFIIICIYWVLWPWHLEMKNAWCETVFISKNECQRLSKRSGNTFYLIFFFLPNRNFTSGIRWRSSLVISDSKI